MALTDEEREAMGLLIEDNARRVKALGERGLEVNLQEGYVKIAIDHLLEHLGIYDETIYDHERNLSTDLDRIEKQADEIEAAARQASIAAGLPVNREQRRGLAL